MSAFLKKLVPYSEIVPVPRNSPDLSFPHFLQEQERKQIFSFHLFFPASSMGKLSPHCLPYLLAVPYSKAGNRPSTSLCWSWHWQALVLQDPPVAVMVSTCLQYSVYGMTSWAETGSLLNTEEDAVGICNWLSWQRAHQVLPSLI